MYRYALKSWKNSEKTSKEQIKQRLIVWRRQPAILRTEGPLRIPRARSLGYRAKQGFIIVRVRVRRGGLRKGRPKGGRRQKHMGITKFTPSKNMKMIAEERADKRFPNLRVLNSYWVGEDGQYKWFEVILVDPKHPSIKNDPSINWICGLDKRGRASRGLTSSGRKVRGLRA